MFILYFLQSNENISIFMYRMPDPRDKALYEKIKKKIYKQIPSIVRIEVGLLSLLIKSHSRKNTDPEKIHIKGNIHVNKDWGDGLTKNG